MVSFQWSVVSGQKVRRCNNLIANVILSAVEGLGTREDFDCAQTDRVDEYKLFSLGYLSHHSVLCTKYFIKL